VVVLHVLRWTLCPSPGLRALLDATSRGRLSFTEHGRRIPQSRRLSVLLKHWILG
jgi:hypothetical protein